MPVPSQERHRPVPWQMLQERPVMLCPVPLHCAHFPLECGSHSRQPPLSPRRSQEGISIYACSIQPETTVSTRLTPLPDISNNAGVVKLFLSTLLSFSFFSPKRVFLFLFLTSLHRRPRLVGNLSGEFSSTQTSLRSKLRP